MHDVKIRIECTGADTLPLDAIEEFQGGLKTRSTKDVESIITSIEKYGFSFPFFIWKGDGHNRCLDGHGRIQALAELRKRGVSLPHFPVAYVEAADEAEAKQKLLRLNSQYGQMTIESVTEFTQGLDVAWGELKLSSGTLSMHPVEEGSGVDAEPMIDIADELRKTWGVEAGQLWELGEHRILCGDCTKAEEVAVLMGKDKAHVCWTDPPWNVAYGSHDHPSWKQRQIANDDLGTEFPRFARSFCASIAANVLPGAPLYLAMSAQEWPVIHAALHDTGFHWSSTIIWAKDQLVLSRKDYHTQYEPIWYGWAGDAPRLHPVQDRTQSDLWPIPRPKRSDEHPTMKPVELVVRSMANSSARGDIVFEPFCGSGTTIIASEQLARRCRAVEISPEYVAVALQRWADATGNTPRRLG